MCAAAPAFPSSIRLSQRYQLAHLDYCVGNLRHRQDAARAVDGVQLIFHLAAGLKGTPADLFLDSVVASRNVLDAIGNRKPMRMVLVSSFGVYGVAGLSRGALLNEQTALEPHPEFARRLRALKTSAGTIVPRNSTTKWVRACDSASRSHLRSWRRAFFGSRRPANRRLPFRSWRQQSASAHIYRKLRPRPW